MRKEELRPEGFFITFMATKDKEFIRKEVQKITNNPNYKTHEKVLICLSLMDYISAFLVELSTVKGFKEKYLQ